MMRANNFILIASLLAASPVVGQGDTTGTKAPKHTLVVQVLAKDTNEPLASGELVLLSEGVEIMRLIRQDTVPFWVELPYVPKIDGFVSVNQMDPYFLREHFSILPMDQTENTMFIKEFHASRGCVLPPPLPEILFMSGSAVLLAHAQDSLAVMEEILRKNPTIIMEIRCHADTMEKDAIAGKRCEAVRKHLIGLGVKRDRLVTKPLGKQEPRSTSWFDRMPGPERTETDLWWNRRVEFRVLSFDWVPEE